MKTYIGVGVVSGILFLALVIIIIIVLRVRSGRKKATTEHAQYDAERRDSYRAYEPDGVKGGEKNLSNWLDSLPRSAADGASPNHTMEVLDPGTLSKSGGNTSSGGNNQQHTLTKTNPYRHKVLTNGSFLNLKDLPSGSSGGGGSDDNSSSSRPTTSTTEDNNSNSGQGSEDNFVNGVGRKVIDTSTARAIIDTYSGNLFCRPNAAVDDTYYNYRNVSSSNYSSTYGGSSRMERDSLENSGLSVYPAVIVPTHHSLTRPTTTARPRDYSPQRQSLRCRTESVV